MELLARGQSVDKLAWEHFGIANTFNGQLYIKQAHCIRMLVSSTLVTCRHNVCALYKLSVNTLITRDVHRTHTPRGTSTGYSAATIDVTSLPIASNKCYRVYCVRVWPYPRCGSDREVREVEGGEEVEGGVYRIYNNVHIVKLKRWGQTLRIIGNSWKNSLNEAP